MRLVSIRIKQNYAPTVDELTALQAAWVYGDEFKLDKDGQLPYYWTSYLVDLDKMPLVPYELERVILNTHLLGLDTETAKRPLAFNQKVNVTVPGLGLLLLDEVTCLTDLCSDALNDQLKQGWRIVAVCPQPDQRRPDYVLGRVKSQWPGDA